VEALIARVAITGPDRLRPVFRLPRPHNNGTATALPAETAPKGMVRTMTKSVELRGLEPPDPSCQAWFFDLLGAPTTQPTWADETMGSPR
jgi:site-specific DNA recombinase